jgi:alpha-glucosidase
MKFLSAVPVGWDDTISLEAKISDFLLIARRNGDNWYLGGMTDWSERDLTLDLSFLPEDKKYKLTLFRDGVNANRIAIDFKRTSQIVDRNFKPIIHLAKGGGVAAMLEAMD